MRRYDIITPEAHAILSRLQERDWLVLEILLVAVKQKLRHLDIQSGAR